MRFPFEDKSRGFVIFAAPYEACDEDGELREDARDGLQQHASNALHELSSCGGCWGSDFIQEGSESCSGLFYVVDPDGDCLFSLLSPTDGEQASVFLDAEEALGSPRLQSNGRVYACIAYSYADPVIEIGDFGREQTEDGEDFENIPTLARRLEVSIEVYLRQPEGSGDPGLVHYASWDADGDLEEEDTLDCMISPALSSIVPTAASCSLGLDGESDDDEGAEVTDDGDDSGGNDDDDEPSGSWEDDLEPKVRAVLESADALEHSEKFCINQVGDDVISSLTEADLVELGIRALGQRKRVLKAIAAIGSVPPAAQLAAQEPSVSPSQPASQRPGVREVPSASVPAHARQATDWELVLQEGAPALRAIERIAVDPGSHHKMALGARTYASQLTSESRLLAVYDDTLMRSAKDGLAVSEMGVHWRNAFCKPGFQPWTALPAATAKGKAVVITPGEAIQCSCMGAQGAQALASFVNRCAGAALASVVDCMHPQRAELRQALLELQRGASAWTASVEAPAVGRFVQMCGESGGITLDIPMAQATQVEAERALGFFPQLGITALPGDVCAYQRTYPAEEIDTLLSVAFGTLQGVFAAAGRSPVRIEVGQ